jgi:hypothetical protein
VGGLCFWFRELFTGQSLFYRDTLACILPFRAFAGDAIRHLRLPAWYPWEGLGVPFIGQISTGTFHPLTLPYAVFSPVVGLKIEVACCGLGCLLGVFFLARELELGALAAVVSASLYGLSGYAGTLEDNTQYYRGMAAIPWVVLCARRGWGPKGGRWVALGGLAWAAILTGGDFNDFLVCGAILGVMVLPDWKARLGPVFVQGVIAVLVSAAEWAPGIGVRSSSIRKFYGVSGAGVDLSADGSLHGWRLPELVAPGWTPPHLGGLVNRVLYGDQQFCWSESITVGSIALALLVVASLRGGRLGLACAALVTSGILLAMGRSARIEPMLREVLPLLQATRFPEKFFVVAVLGVSLGAGMGLDLLEKDRANRHLFVRTSVGLAVLLLTAWGVAIRFGPTFLGSRGMPGPSAQELAGAWSQGLLGAGVAALMAAALPRFTRRPGAFIAGLVAVQLVQARLAVSPPVVPDAAIESTPIFCKLAHEGGAGLGLGRVQPIRVDLPTSDPEASLAVARNLLLPDGNQLCRLETFFTRSMMPNTPLRTWLLASAGLPDALARVFNIPFVLRDLRDGPLPADEHIVGVLPESSIGLVERPSSPRVAVADVEMVPSTERALKELGDDPGLSPRVALVQGTGPSTEVGAVPPGQVVMEDYHADRIRLRATMQRTGASVLNDLFDRGWSATLDDRPVPVYPANVAVRAVIAERGTHEVVFTYRNPYQLVGLLISLLGIVLSIATASRAGSALLGGRAAHRGHG